MKSSPKDTYLFPSAKCIIFPRSDPPMPNLSLAYSYFGSVTVSFRRGVMLSILCSKGKGAVALGLYNIRRQKRNFEHPTGNEAPLRRRHLVSAFSETAQEIYPPEPLLRKFQEGNLGFQIYFMSAHDGEGAERILYRELSAKELSRRERLMEH